MTDPDDQLMFAFQNGDQRAFESLMHKYYGRLLNFIYRYVGSREIAEDLTQDTFIKVYHAATQYQPQSQFKTWIFTIAKNLSLNELRRRKFQGRSLDETFETEDGPILQQVPDEEADQPDQAVVKKELAATIQKAVQELPENQRMAVILCRYEQFSYEEIAQAMGTSVKAVKSLLSRAKENLRIHLAKFVEE